MPCDDAAAKSYSYETNESHLPANLLSHLNDLQPWHAEKHFFGTALEGRGTIRTITQVRVSSLKFFASCLVLHTQYQKS